MCGYQYFSCYDKCVVINILGSVSHTSNVEACLTTRFFCNNYYKYTSLSVMLSTAMILSLVIAHIVLHTYMVELL